MPRTYKPKPGGKSYKKYDELMIQKALADLKSSSASLQAIAEKYNISKTVLFRHQHHNVKPQGGQTALSNEVEEFIVQNLNLCADWGYPLDTTDLRYIVKMYLDTQGITHKRFKNNYPGIDFVNGFLKRHQDKISKRICQNIKRSRAAVSPKAILEYFAELEKSLENIPPSNIVNYDETNLADDPGCKKVIVRRGCKYPERVVNHSKGCVSLMMAASAEGELLPPYVVYKSSHLYDTWVKNGPNGTRYNRSASGWFDGESFTDWIETIAIPFLDKKQGKKILIGDNLSSHLSLKVIQLCKEKNIDFVFLPANSTHLTQPLDVAFFRPLKVAWRQILDQWKKTDGREMKSVPKGCFSRLLKLLIDKIKLNSENNIKAGFKKSGIVPLDSSAVLSKLPTEKETSDSDKDAIDQSFIKLLKEMRFGTMNITEPKRKRKLDVIAGRSVNEEEAVNQNNTVTVKKSKNTSNKDLIPSTSEPRLLKGKGKGKKTIKNTPLQNIHTDSKIIKNDRSDVIAFENRNEEVKINNRIELNTEIQKTSTLTSLNKKESQVEQDAEEITQIIYPLQKSSEERFNRKKACYMEKTKSMEDKKNLQHIIYNEDKDTAELSKLGKENILRTDEKSVYGENTVSKVIVEEINCNQSNIEDMDFNYADFESMPIVLSEDLDLGYQEEVFVSSECQTSNELTVKKNKIEIISDIKLRLALSRPATKKNGKPQPLPKEIRKSQSLPQKKTNKTNSKNYYNNTNDILNILEQD